jgi:hypothetical protein
VVPFSSIPALVQKCREPLETWWPAALSAAVVNPADRLIDGTALTRACRELALDVGDVAAELLERSLISDVFAVCRAANAQDSYVAFRSLVIERPAMTFEELDAHASRRELARLRPQLEIAYEEAPPECVKDGAVVACPHCLNLLVRHTDGWRCTDDSCVGALGGVRPGREYRSTAGVLWLRADLRTFIAAPGRAEMRLARLLRSRGLSVELWPSLDAYDLRIVFADGRTWAVDVKDWTNPIRLARSVARIPVTPPWDRGYFVFPRERVRRQPDYPRLFEANCDLLGGSPPVFARGEAAFLREATRTMEEPGNA